jgi:transposase
LEVLCLKSVFLQVLHAFNREGMAALSKKSNRPHSGPAAAPVLDEDKRHRLHELLEQSPRAFGKDTSVWTLAVVAQVAHEQGLTSTRLNIETIRIALKRLGLNWRRAKAWIASPDPAYARKKSGATSCGRSCRRRPISTGSVHACMNGLVVCRRTRQVIAAAMGRCWAVPLTVCKFGFFHEGIAPILQTVRGTAQHRPSEKGTGQTNKVERFNLTLRQRLGRFVRKTLSFSKSSRRHWYALLLFLHEYNRYCVNRFKLTTADPASSTWREPLPFQAACPAAAITL